MFEKLSCKGCGVTGDRYAPGLCVAWDEIYSPQDVLVNEETGLCGNCTGKEVQPKKRRVRN